MQVTIALGTADKQPMVATAATKVELVFPSGIAHSFNKAKPVTALTRSQTEILDELVKAKSSSHAVMSALVKAGIRSSAELYKSYSAFLKKASTADLNELLTPAARTRIVKKLAGSASFKSKGRIYSRRFRRGMVKDMAIPAGPRNNMLASLCYLYAYIGVKLCAGYKISYTQAVPEFLLTGVGSKLPLQIKSLLVASKKLRSVKVLARNIEDLKLKDFKTVNHMLVSQLPEMYNDFVARIVAATPSKVGKILTAAQQRAGYSRSGLAYRRKLERGTTKASAAGKLHEAVGDELFEFYSHVIPALISKKMVNKDDKVKAARMKVENAAQLKRRAMYNMRGSGTRGPTKVVFEKMTKALTEARANLLKVRKVVKAERANTIKPWMLPYIDSTVDISHVKTKTTLDNGTLLHRLVVRANANKVKKGDPELNAVLDTPNAALLTYKAVANIVKAFDDSTIEACKGVFSKVLDIVKPKLFTIAMSDTSGRGLDTATGKVTNERLLRLNKITVDQEKSMSAQFKKEMAAWNPAKTDIKDVMAKIDKSDAVKASSYKVHKSSPAQLAAYRKDLPQFMAHVHNVEIRIMKSWEVDPSPRIQALLKNVSKSKELKVIRNVFHGCSKQSGSIILHCGFKLTGTQVTGRSMGDVLYMAPNVDKSAQYMKGTGHSRDGTGIIFMGDAIVAGASIGHADQMKNKQFGWTKKGNFATEEIGLVNPNMQFVIRHVFLIKTSHAADSAVKAKKTLAKEMKKFESPAPVGVLGYS